MFEEVLAGTRPGELVYEDSRTFAFLDAEPAVLGHALVVSRVVVDRIYELPSADYHALWETVRMLAPVLQAVTNTSRVVVLAAGFEVAHAHVHLMPGNSRREVLGQHALQIEGDELANLAARVRAAL